MLPRLFCAFGGSPLLFCAKRHLPQTREKSPAITMQPNAMLVHLLPGGGNLPRLDIEDRPPVVPLHADEDHLRALVAWGVGKLAGRWNRGDICGSEPDEPKMPATNSGGCARGRVARGCFDLFVLQPTGPETPPGV